jgi:MFS family permease
MNIAYSLTAYPAGKLSDRIGRRGLMAFGLLVLIGSDLLLAFAENIWWVFAGAALWGLHLGLTQGILSALIADATAPHLRGTAFGVFGLISGVSILLASLLAGCLWQQFGADSAFFSGALIATVSLVGFLLASPNLQFQSRKAG